MCGKTTNFISVIINSENILNIISIHIKLFITCISYLFLILNIHIKYTRTIIVCW